MKGIFRFILFRLMGWKVQGKRPPELMKFIIIVAPHTSNWDFIIGVLVRPLINLSKAKFIGKAELFKPPYGWMFKKMGGYPVDRSRANNLVDATIQIFNEHEEFYIAIAPEGTRKYTGKIKSGFYHIAMGAQIPIITAGFDYPSKTVILNDPFYPTGDMEKDMERFMSDFSKIKGKNPEDGLP